MSEIRVNNVIADNGLDAVNFAKGINVSSGVITATSFSGSGANLTGISAGTALSGSTNNTVCTVTGANAIQGESGLTYNGTRLDVTTGDLQVIGGEGGNAEIRIVADQGDDGADYWRFQSNASNNNLNLATYTSGSWVDKVSITKEGYVTKAAQPCASMTVSGTLLSGNYMQHNAVHTNIGSHYATGTGIFTCPVAGLYYVSIMVMSNNNDQSMDLEFHINGSNSNNILVPYQAGTGGQYNQVSGSTIVECPVNAQLRFKLNSGSIYGGRHSNITFALFA